MDAVLIAGGGIGGLAASLACAQAGMQVRLFERAPVFSEFGAGIQLGPNVTRVLSAWGLDSAMQAVVGRPARMHVMDGLSGTELASVALGDYIDRYGAPYWTIHRGDLHELLLRSVEGRPDVQLNLNAPVMRVTEQDDAMVLAVEDRSGISGHVVVAADGAWSALRAALQGDGSPRPTGHLAYRALVRQTDLPAALRTQQVTLWLAPRLHVVHYPVRGGDWLNIVAIVEGQITGDWAHWDHSANAVDLRRAAAGLHRQLQQRLQSVEAWRLWPLSFRTPVHGPYELARGRVAWLGDAAHPMVPYLAQGAAMAIEDAAVLARCLARVREGHTWRGSAQTAQALQDYAQRRWPRVSKVQRRAWHNGRIFHMTGLLRFARNSTLRALGEVVLDQPWLYGQVV